MKTIPERFSWAKEIVNPQPQEKILEIGCGAGLLIETMASALDKGKITALDKSAAMIEKARKRNQVFVDEKRVELVCMDFMKADFGKTRFDSIVAFNVNFFLKISPKEIARVKELLKPDGKVFVFYQAPYEIGPEAAELFKKQLQEHGFRKVKTGFKKLSPTSAVYAMGELG